MADDLLGGVFGPAAAKSPSDPLADVFGGQPNPDFTTDPLHKPAGKLASALEGKSPEEAAAEQAHSEAIQRAAQGVDDGLDDNERRVREHQHQRELDNEGLLTVAGKSLRGFPARAQQWLGGILQTAGELPSQAPSMVLESVFGPIAGKGFGELFREAAPKFQAALDAASNNPITRKGREVSRLGEEALREIDPDYRPGSFNDYAFQTFNAFQDMAGAAAVTIGTRNPEAGAAVLGAEVFGQQYDESRQQGRTPGEAMQDAAFNGVAEMIGEDIPLGMIMKPGGKFLGKVFKTAAAEGIQELVTQALQSGYDKGVLHPDMKWSDVLQQVVQAGIIGSIAGGTTAAALHPLTREDEALPGADVLGQGAPKPPEAGRSYNVGDAIAELGMSPEEAKQFVATGKDPRATAPALEEHGFTPGLTESDQSSPIDDSIIAEGKELLGSALEQHSPLKGKAKGKASLPMDVVQGLIKAGIPEHIARGAAAGTVAEDNANEKAVNPTSGAFGLGQWLGSRKQGLIERYGPNPTRAQQIEYLAYELKGGDFGGKSVLSAKDETEALHRYITDFMRPAKGAETSGDLERGMAALGRAGEAIQNLREEAANLGAETGTEDRGAASTVEGTLAQAGINLGEDVQEFAPGQRIDVTQNESTVPGTVREVYGEGADKGVRVDLDNGTTFDEVISRARDYGARLTHPVEAPIEEKSAPKVEVPDVADPLASAFASHVGEKIDDEFTAFHKDTGTLGVPRAEMPQIKQEQRGAFVNFLEARGIEHDAPAEIPVAELKPTQAEFAPAKVESFKQRDSGERSVLVSSDGYVLDGHHQYVAALERGGTVRAIRLHAPIRELITAAHAFPSSTRSEGASQAQPDMFGGETLTAEQMDARRFAPRILREVTKAGKLDDLADATDYVLRRSEKESSTPGDKAQSAKELSQLIGRNLSRKEATAYALEIERMRDAGEDGRPKPKSAGPTVQVEVVHDSQPQDETSRKTRLARELYTEWSDNLDGVGKRLGKPRMRDETDAAYADRLTRDNSLADVRDALRAEVGPVAKAASTAHEHADIGEAKTGSFIALGIRGLAVRADEALNGRAAKAIDDFIGVPAGTVDDPNGATSGAMLPQALEDAYSSTPSAAGKIIRQSIDRAFEPVRAALTQKLGSSVKLYRFQAPVEHDENTIYMSRGKDAVRNVLSWTTDPKVAEWFAGVDPKRERTDYTEEQIAKAEREFAENGRVDIRKGRWLQREDDGSILIMDDSVGGMVTDVDSVRHYFEDENRFRAEDRNRNAKKRDGIIEAEVPLTAVVWISDRAGQAEFIVQNLPGMAHYVGPDGKLAPEPIADQPTEAPANVAAAEALREKAAPHQDELAAFGKAYPEFINPGLKSAERIVEKLEKEGYESLDEIKDVARAGFKVESRERGNAIAAMIKTKFGDVRDKNWRMVDGDYFDRKLIIEWPDGVKAEIQIIPDALEDFRHEGGGSELYTKWRSTEPGAEKDALLRKMEDGYAKAAAGTSWESFFNELKSARGNALRASSEESETPGLVANPGAGRQTSAEDQTTAQARPETAPEATSRSSTSKNENAPIGSNVGNERQVGNLPSARDQASILEAIRRGLVPDGDMRLMNHPRWAVENGYATIENQRGELTEAGKAKLEQLTKESVYGGANKIVTRDQAEIARAIIRAKLKNQLNSGFDPELLSAGMQLAAFHLEAGARRFGEFAKAVADDLGTRVENLKPYLAAWYNGARDMLEAHGADVSDMDVPEVVRESIASLSTGVGDNNGDNGAANAGTAADEGTEGVDRAGDAGSSAGDALGAERSGSAGQGALGEGGPGAGQLRAGDERGEQPGAVEQPESVGSGSDERDDAGAKRGGSRSAQSSRRLRDTSNGTDFRASPGDLARTGSWKDAAERNLDIIELVNRLEAENRPATPEEQSLLAKWVGWGSSEIRNNLFRYVDRRAMRITPSSYGSGEWTNTIKRAAELLHGKDLETALQSVQYAHYTSEGIVRSMWDAFERMGFEGGRILEPGMGIGHFFTAAPAAVAEHSTYTGVELDAFTAKVAKYLLPQENVIQGDYTKQSFPDGFFDAAIGNPPFANTKVLDDPAYKKMRLSLHNYFFVKTLDKVRPGGILAFITSRYTMDAIDPKQRAFMADRADLVGAIRLPQTAFKQNAGTDVVTDVLFFQRRAPGAEPGGADWLNVKQVTVDHHKVNINSYFAEHPEMVLGKHKIHRGMYREDDLTVEPYASKGSIEKQFAEAVKNLPENIYTAQVQKGVESLTAKTFERDFAPASSKEGGLYVKDGKLLVVDRGSGVPVEAIHEGVRPTDHAWLKSYVKLRDLLKEAQKAQLQDADDWEKKLDALRKEYRAFVKQHGRIKEFTAHERTTKDENGDEQTVVYRRFKWQRLLVDVESPLVETLERITDAGEIEDGPFLKGRTLNKPTRPKIETVDDALAVTLDEIGKLDLEYIAKLANLSRDDVVNQLGERIYQTPAGEWQTADEYLSGNVLQKLEEAQVAAAAHPEFQRNVEALLKVQPKPLSYDRIAVKLGAPWIRPETVSQFAEEVLGERQVPISYEPTTAHWHVEGAKQRFRRSLTNDYGTPDRSPLELLDAVLNNRSIKVTRKGEDKKEVVDADATAAAVEAAKKIGDRFKTWLWEDSARTAEYVETYNRSYNNIAPRQFDGSHLTLPGLSALFKPHPHVKRAVWRIIQTGNTYLAHAVGAGKTAEQIISGMEQRRLGLIKKPMYVVPNHMLKQFSGEFMELYPAANIMVADEQAFHTGNRRRFLAQAALNDPDAIIITHSAFGKIDTTPEMRAQIVDGMIAELEDAAKEAQGTRHLVSRIEKQIEQLKRRFESKTGAGKDKLLTFDELGVDMLYVDEAHEFRKLDFATNRTAKGIDSSGSQRALDLFIKSQWLEQQNPGRSLVLASGTPVTNTMAELYTVMKYMDLKGLERDGIAAFDAWANMFGEVVAGYERNAAGGYEIVERFAKFVNVPELMKRVRNFMDVLTSAQLGDLVVRPKIRGGGPQNVITPTSDDLDGYMKGELETRLKKSREWKPSRAEPANPDPVINIITDARLSAIDMRFINPNLPSDPDSKLNQMIAKIAEKHREYGGLEYTNKDGTRQPRKGAAQIVFSPVGLGEQVAVKRGFDVRGWIDGELQRLGVKKSEIGWMSDANTHAKKQQLQKDVRSGKVRIIIGSPKNMGTGLNVQDRLKVLHFLAPPWYPSDVTQPHGRIERQGNQNSEAEIYWYATKGTYDSTGWGMVARKQKFIDDAMAGDDDVRSLEDISEINMFEMAAALAAGDDRVIRIAALSGEVEKLTRLKGAHADTQRSLRTDITTAEKFELPRLEERRAELKRAQEARGGYQPFSMTVAGQTFDKNGEAGEALKVAAQQAMDSTTALEKTEIGKLYGKFPVSIDATRLGDFQLYVDVGGVPFQAGRPFERVENVDSVGITRSIEAAVQRIPSELQETARKIDEVKRQLEASKRKYGAPFPEEAQLNEAIAERNRLQAEMAAETKAKEDAKKQQPAPSAKVAPLVKAVRELTPEQASAMAHDLQAQLNKLLPGDKVAFEAGYRIFDNRGNEAQGLYWHRERLIQLALEITADPTWTLSHEAVHAMNSLGLFSEHEWTVLVREAWYGDKKLREQVQRQWGHLNLTDEQLQEEAVAEMFGDYASIHRYADQARGAERLIIRSLLRVLKFLGAVARTLRKALGKPLTVKLEALDLMERMRTGEIGSREIGSQMPPLVPRDGEPSAKVAGTAPPSSPDFGGETERRWQEAKKGIGDGPSTLEKAKAWWEDLTAGFTRHWRALPNEPRFADVQQQLRKLEAAPHAAMAASVQYLRDLVSGMDAKEYDLFARKVVLDDLAWDAGEGRDLPFGFTPASLTAARASVDALVNANPKLVRAVRERKRHNAAIADAMVNAGVLTKEQIKNPAYFRHMVLDYARHEAALARTPNSVKSPYWAKRMGSTLDINANLLEAELDWLQKAQVDVTTADTIEWIKKSPHNTRSQLQAQARADNKAGLDAILKSNPSARKEDGWFRSNIARGFQIVKAELAAGSLDPIPAEFRRMADDIINDRRGGDSALPLMAWIADSRRPGDMGARMVLKYTGLKKQWERTQLGDKWLDTADIASLVRHYKPEGQVAWQPKEGRHLFTAKTISESALDMFASKLADSATPGIDREELARALGTVRKQLVVGGDRYTMVLPEELAATLDEFGDRRGEGMVARVAAGIQAAWKRWVLINPRRYLKYNLNNQTGDLDAIIAGNPAALRRVPEAWRILREASKGKIDPRYTEALKRGVFTSALSAQEIPDINRLSAFRHLTEDRGNRPDKLVVEGVGKVWRALQDSTNFRESLFRLAAYLDYVQKIEAGVPQLKIGYGASVPRMVDAVADPKDRAAMLARDLIGDYGSISVAGSWLRRYLVPFWSWMEINTRRYWRLTGNAFTVSKARGIATGGALGASIAARTAIGLYIRMGLVYGLLYLWNHLLWPDEEKDLGEVQRAQLHLILGRDSDGNVITLRTQGALSDVLSELGFTDAMHAFNKWRDGQGSLGSVITDGVKAPINRVATSVRPEINELVEQLIGQELWPDVFHPRVIHDRLRHAAQTVNLENEYDLIAQKPSRGYGESWTGSLVYKRNPDEMAYDEARTIAYDWLERTKGERGGSSTSDRGEALRDYRLALRYGDKDAADKALARYEELGGTKKTLERSIKQAHPLGPIPKKDRAAFLASLTDEQLDTFERAERYWQDVFEGQ